MNARPLLTLNAGEIKIFADRVTVEYTGQDGSLVRTNHMVVDDAVGDTIILNVGEDKPEPLLGSTITVYYDKTENGYTFQSRVLEVKRLRERHGLKVWIIAKPTEARHHKSRRAFRVDGSLPATVAWYGRERAGSVAMTVTDLSFRGCRTVLNITNHEPQFSLHDLVTAEHHWLTLAVTEKFLDHEVERIRKARVKAGNGATKDSSEIRAELCRKLERIPVTVRQITRQRLRTDETILIVGWEFHEFPAMNRLVSWLELEALRKLNWRRLKRG